MARDGSGTYTTPATFAVANEPGSSTTVNAVITDIAQALTDSLNKDGSKALEGDQPFGGNKATGLGAATALTDAAQYGQVQKGNVSQATTVAGTVDAITLAFTPAITSLTTGMRIRWISAGVNTVVAPTINLDSTGAKTLKKNPGAAALAAGDTGASGMVCEAVYNGTDFILVTGAMATSVAASTTASGIVELATTTETLTGTDATRAVTPDSLAALWEQGADIASAGTISVGEGSYFAVSGTTTITDIDPGTDKAGREFELRFDGALTLTHGAALILPGAANITTAAGDVARFRSEGTDVVRCVSYTRASGQPVVAAGGMTLLGSIATTSGSEVALTSLTLTGYKQLVLVFEGVSHNSGAAAVRIHSASGANQVSITSGTTSSSETFRGFCWVDLNAGTFHSSLANVGTTNSATVGYHYAGDTTITTAATAVYVSVDAGAFDAGSVRVYGVS